MEKQTKRTFRWGTLVPIVLTAPACIFLFCNNVLPPVALAVTVGALLLAAGAVCAVAFFAGQPVHVARMLAGVVCVSVGVWALATCTDFGRSVLALGLGIFLAVFAAAEGFGAYAARRSIPACAVRCVLALGYAATGALLIANNFAHVFPSVSASLVTAGAVILFACAEEAFLLLRGGLYAEEMLVFSPAKKEETRKKEV